MRLRLGATMVGAMLVLLTAACSGAGSGAQHDTSPQATAVTGRTTPPPWDRPADQKTQVEKAGMSLLSEEGTAVHYHAHLDVIVDGQPVQVPAGLGISVTDKNGNIPGTHTKTQGGIAALHTHDPSGVLHIEAPKDNTYTLGQVFTLWNVALGPGQVGGFHDGEKGTTVGVFVDGKRYDANPVRIELKAHEEIAVEVATNGSSLPSPPASYDFPSGE